MNCPKCRSPLEGHHLSGAASVDACPTCFGVFYDKADLAAPLELEVLSASGLGCPRCGSRMEVGQAGAGKLVVDRCSSCAGVWFDMGEIQALRKLTGLDQVAAAREPPPARGPSAAGPPGRGGAIAAPDMAREENRDAIDGPTVTHDGRRFEHFQTSIAVTTHVLGEFPWLAASGDRVRARDFVCPPYLLSHEASQGESTWSLGEYVSPEEVWAAFGTPVQAAAPRGVAPAQPNPWAEHGPAVERAFWRAAAAAACLYALLSLGGRPVVFDGGFSWQASEADKSRVSGVFEIPGRVANVQVNLETDVDNHWAAVNLALINADTDEALDFGAEASYYHGYEGGESWSEGSSRARVYVPGVPPGRYYLRLEPEFDAASLSLRARLVRGVPLLRLLFIALALLLVPAAWRRMREAAFENERWMESDHPRTSSEEDDDE